MHPTSIARLLAALVLFACISLLPRPVLAASPAVTHILWTNTNGSISVWTINADGSHTVSATFGPYAGWTAKALADGADGNPRILWTNGNGQMSLWDLNTATGKFTQSTFGPYSGWTATDIGAGDYLAGAGLTLTGNQFAVAVPLSLSGSSYTPILSVTNSLTSGVGGGAGGAIAGSAGGSSGFGVYGSNGSSGDSGGLAGPELSTGNSNPVGVFGDDSSPSGYGVFGNSNTGTGVFGNSAGNSAGAAGIIGSSSSSGVDESGSGIGVYGVSGSGSGVKGSSGGGIGVKGNSTGIGNGAIGVVGSSSSSGEDAGGGGTGVYGVSGSGIGVLGSSGNNSGVKGSSGTGIGVSAAGGGVGLSGPALYATNTNSAGIGLYSLTSSTDANLVVNNTGTGDLIKGFNGLSALNFEVTSGGNVTITGTLTAPTKHFRIDDPIDPANKYLAHASIESDEMTDIYSGNATLGKGGAAWVTMPRWFQALNQDFRYQLTCVGGFAPVYIAQKVQANKFQIAGGKPGMEVSWQVTGVRHDTFAVANPLQVEQDKPPSERGSYVKP